MINSASLLRRWRSSGLIGLIVCLIVIALLLATRPGPVNALRTDRDVDLGQVARARAFEVRATDVTVGTAAVDEVGQQIRTEHRLVVVNVEASVLREQNQLETDLITLDGHRHHPRAEFSSAGPTTTAPGFTRTYTVVYEVPVERVAGARLLLDDVRGFEVHHEAVRVDLGLTDDTEVSRAPIVVVDTVVRVTS
ncbi:hypothetical protein ACQBAR_11320 [Propionibacteriaceae bacterium Y1685]